MSEEDFYCAPPERALMEELLRQLHDCRVAAEFDALAELLADNVCVTYVGRRPDFQFAGVYRGREEVMALYKRLHSEVEFISSVVAETIIDGDTAFCRRLVHVQHRGTGLCGEHEAWDIWRARRRQLVEGRVFIDLDAFHLISQG